MVKPARAIRRKAKNDPTLVAAARELRDRWLEQVNNGVTQFESQGKYDVTRAIGGHPTVEIGNAPRPGMMPVKLLAA